MKATGSVVLACLAHAALAGAAAPESYSFVHVCSSITPWTFNDKEIALRVNRRRAQGLLSRLVANLGGAVDTSFLAGSKSLYADKPLQDDDPYRYYRW